jgi:hypothetical protein
MKLNRTATTRVALGVFLSAVSVLGVLMSGCGSEPTATPTPTKTPTLPAVSTPTPAEAAGQSTPTPTPTATSTPREEATPTATATVTPTYTPTPVPLVEMGPDINPLTGLKADDPTRLDRRPIAVKIPNYPAEARPQSGLSLADVVVEHEAEAYLTRFTAIFLGNDVAPELGPVRSIRLVDAELVPIFKSVLVTSGGHMAVILRATEDKPWAEGYARVISSEEPFVGDGGALRRIPKEGRRYELTMYTETASLWGVVSDRDLNERQDFHDMWVFSELAPAGGVEATYLKVVYKASEAMVEYKYDAESHTYKRFDLGQPLIDALNDEQIAPSNVLVLYVNHVDTDIAADTHDPNRTWYSVSIQLWGAGPAKLMRDRQVYEGQWVRENPQQPNDRLVIVDGNGRQIPFRPGATWIQLVRLDGDVQLD